MGRGGSRPGKRNVEQSIEQKVTKLTTDTLQSMSKAANLIKQISSDGNWQWANTEHTVGKLQKALKTVQDFMNGEVNCLLYTPLKKLKTDMDELALSQIMHDMVSTMSEPVEKLNNVLQFVMEQDTARKKWAGDDE